ncbi:MAG: DUF4956 domain-containing protein [Hungatella sp.]|jgi:uncharacterized membrane protein YhiD involved in acid resistance|nr:DUF4956 domain-containing protein [Hungatella sp.]
MKKELFELFGSPNDLSAEVILARLSMATVIGFFIFLSYRLSHDGSIYSKKFNVSLVTLTIITTTVMIVIGNNLAMSLGMVGALSIVRFRTAIKDSRDAVYIFWTIVAGICCGAGDYVVAAMGSAFIFTVLLLFGRIRNENRVLMIIRGARVNEGQVEALIFQRFSRKATLRVKNSTETNIEFIYELSKKVFDKKQKTDKSIMDEIYAIGNIEYFNVVTQNDDISS